MSSVIRNAPSPLLKQLQRIAKRSFAAVAGVGISVTMMAVPESDIAEADDNLSKGYSRSTENYLLRQGCDVEPLRRGQPADCSQESEFNQD